MSIPMRHHETVLAQLTQGLSTDHLYDLVAATLTELKAREDASDEPDGLDLDYVHIAAEFGEICYDAGQNRFLASFYSEGSAVLAAEQVGAEVARDE